MTGKNLILCEILLSIRHWISHFFTLNSCRMGPCYSYNLSALFSPQLSLTYNHLAH